MSSISVPQKKKFTCDYFRPTFHWLLWNTVIFHSKHMKSVFVYKSMASGLFWGPFRFLILGIIRFFEKEIWGNIHSKVENIINILETF